MSPVRVPLMMPPVGVSPMDVSMHLPFRIAEMEAPLPRCATISFFGTSGCNWYTIDSYEIPCAPYRRTPIAEYSSGMGM